MAEEVIMPKLGASMEKGTILSWFKNEGDPVEKGEPLLEIMTDKINMEVEATSSGILLKRCYGADTEVDVLKPIAYIGEAGAKIPETANEGPKNESTAEITTNSMDEIKEKEGETAIPQVMEPLLSRPRRTPAARKLAAVNGIDLREVKGTGPNQRIQLRDIEVILKNRKKATPLAKEIAKQQEKDLTTITGSGHKGKIQKQDLLVPEQSQEKQYMNYDGLRKIIGDRMTHSAQNVPQVTLHCDIDMTEVVALRKDLLPKIEKRTGFRISYTDIFVKFAAHTLKKHPILNSSFRGGKIELHSAVNIGVAVDVPNGLVVPVVKEADKKTLSELTSETKRLVRAAQANKLSFEQISGGTFSISNLGMFAVDSFNPIINEPESAILGIGRIREQLVQKEGSIQTISQVTFNLTFDHRVIDGAAAARYLTDLKNALENPYELFI
ncbi:pyruvate dehydrogenase E2 component (dihydrolipoamide acetyltransferase) [Cytobacillus oceanisediminis]|uniref:Dihydrolipoamide acetyltransferase component of pyruvate dehydrogenase complex n=1 Tax=Cytobacillus oceanisediminis TaxID=665099 RepID=A0A2V3A8F2_9BACI|nr:dihydrolipoamide acetyltransferase family protein [Cytobacillus oceanisediminis]PWW32350.1 pyruvate dehydrogenase E2 component (dihydrolipoamide acetyltransferase) [Cytobacillus oceanisediminis]